MVARARVVCEPVSGQSGLGVVDSPPSGADGLSSSFDGVLHPNPRTKERVGSRILVGGG